MRFGSFIALASLAVPTLGRLYNILNRCPSAINIYVAGRPLETIASNLEISFDLSDDEAYFYTDANSKSGSSNGTRVGFKLEEPYGYYYMVVDPNNFNVGVVVTPISPVVGSPLHSCISDTMTYTILYCPDETWPPTSVTVQSDGNIEYCLGVQDAKFENGTPVQMYECNGTPAQQWVFNGFSTKVKVAGTNFCLDAGSNPGNGVGMKIWKCYDGLPAQAWYYTGDERLALEGQGLCLDLANGTNGNGSFVQTWQCISNDNNQVWSLTWK